MGWTPGTTTRMLLRAGFAAGLLAAQGGLGVLAMDRWHLVAAAGPADLDEALTLVAAVAAFLLGLWLLLSTAAAVLAHLPGATGAVADRVADAWAPALSRRVAAALVSASLGGAFAPGTALAGATGPASPPPGFAVTAPAGTDLPGAPLRVPGPGFTVTDPAPAAAAPQPGWTPSRPLQRRQPSAALVTTSPAARARDRSPHVVVHRGDTLWGIVAAQLGPGAGDAEVAAAWPRWYAANRTVIGDDPDLLLPGQVLVAPDAAVAR